MEYRINLKYANGEYAGSYSEWTNDLFTARVWLDHAKLDWGDENSRRANDKKVEPVIVDEDGNEVHQYTYWNGETENF